jgi:XisI protein
VATLKSPVPFEQLTPEQKAIWHVFEPMQQWKTRGIEYEFVFDTANDQYQVLMHGWQGSKRLHHVMIHLAIRGQYVWIEENNTEIDFTPTLIEHGVGKDRIVLGFYPPAHRTAEGFALGTN